MRTKKNNLHFRVETANLLQEIVDNALRPGTGVLRVPLNILRELLVQMAGRCTELNDPILNRICFDLTLYELPQASSPEYGKLMKRVYEAEKKYIAKQKA